MFKRLVLGGSLFVAACAGSAKTELPLEERVARLVSGSGAEVGVAFRSLDGRDELLVSPDASFHAASTMKIPVLIELFRQQADGRLSLDDELVVSNEFASLVDGSPFSLSPEDDSDPEIYQRIGEPMTLRELGERMIAVSSNLATNLLIVRLGVQNIQATVERLGAGGMRVLRCLEDGKAYRQGLSNTTTARGLLVLLEKIGHLQAVDEASSLEMIEILKRQQFDEGIPSGLPTEVEVAHKTGQITAIHHDAGIVYAPRPYVLVVLVRGLEDERESAELIGRISREVYRYVTGP